MMGQRLLFELTGQMLGQIIDRLVYIKTRRRLAAPQLLLDIIGAVLITF